MKKHLKKSIAIIAAVALLSIAISLSEDSGYDYTNRLTEQPLLSGAGIFKETAQAAQITGCQVINTPGSYTLDQNILQNDSTTCIDIVTDNVTLNCQNFIVDGINGTNARGIFSLDTYNITIGNCTVTDWGFGIVLAGVAEAKILDNTVRSISSNALVTGGNSTIRNNLVHNATNAVYIPSRNNVTISNNRFENSTRALNISGSVLNVLNNTIKNGFNEGILAECSNSNFIDNNVSNSPSGIKLDNTSVSNVVSNNIIYNSTNGIEIKSTGGSCTGSTIRDNEISLFSLGIYLYQVGAERNISNNLIKNNTIESGTTGIYTSNVALFNNISANTVQQVTSQGIQLSGSSNFVTEKNTLYNTTAVGLYLDSSTTNITASNNNITGPGNRGIEITSGGNNTLTGNRISSYSTGMYISSSNLNNITSNTVHSNTLGINMTSSNNNRIFNNNFTNTNNADDASTNFWNRTKTAGTNIIGGPNLGGNFYSDYTGIDTDNDGIGQTTYSIPGGANVDYLPLINNLSTALTIWDELDSGFPYGGQSKYVGDTIYFYANYTSAGSIITSATCNIEFEVAPTGPSAMSYNGGKTLYEYTRSFSSTGTYKWNVTCNKSGYDTKFDNDTITINNQPTGGGGGGPAGGYTPTAPALPGVSPPTIGPSITSNGQGIYDPGNNRINIDFRGVSQHALELELDLVEQLAPGQSILIRLEERPQEEARERLPTNKEIMAFFDIIIEPQDLKIDELRLTSRIENNFFLEQRIDPNPGEQEAITISNGVQRDVGITSLEELRDSSYSYFKIISPSASSFAILGTKVPKPVVNYIPVQVSLVVLIIGFALGIALLRKQEAKEEIELPSKLEEYIDRQITKKTPKTKVRKHLLDAGWKQEIIDRALKDYPNQ